MRQKILHAIFFIWMMFLATEFGLAPAFAENIDPDDDGSQYAYGENVGWINFEPGVVAADVGATVTGSEVTGLIWAENIGWINLDPNIADPNVGITNDGTGLLSGYAWGENVGWINFNPKVPGDPRHYGVFIDEQGNFGGRAWGQNIGWIHLRSSNPVSYRVRTAWIGACRVGFDDLANFLQYWLNIGDVPGDINDDDRVDLTDYTLFADWWLMLCPPDWPFGEI